MNFIKTGKKLLLSNSDGDNSLWKILKDGLNGPGDYAAFLIGGGVGSLVDLASFGMSGGHGAVGGALLGLGAKKMGDTLWQKKRLKKQCMEYIDFYSQEGDQKRVQEFHKLIKKIDIVRSLTPYEIGKNIFNIENNKFD